MSVVSHTAIISDCVSYPPFWHDPTILEVVPLFDLGISAFSILKALINFFQFAMSSPTITCDGLTRHLGGCVRGIWWRGEYFTIGKLIFV